MKFASIWSAATFAACAVAEDAYLWTVDHGSVKYANTQASSISSGVASSIIARRRGFSNDQYSTSADGRALKDVNQYGGYQMPMYGSGSDPIPAKLFIRITGFTGSMLFLDNITGFADSFQRYLHFHRSLICGSMTPLQIWPMASKRGKMWKVFASTVSQSLPKKAWS